MTAAEFRRALRKARFVMVHSSCGCHILTTKAGALEALRQPWGELTANVGHIGSDGYGTLFIGGNTSGYELVEKEARKALP